jgi:hypothetical protein
MLAGEQSFAYALFRDEPSAAGAVRGLIQAQFATERIGALMLDESGVREVPMRHKTGMVQGVAIGTLLGATAGAFLLPGLGLIAIGGVFGAVEAATIGGATGTLAGAMGGMGFWKDEFDFPASAFERGGVLVGVLTSSERAPDAKAVLLAAGAQDAKVSTRALADPR